MASPPRWYSVPVAAPTSHFLVRQPAPQTFRFSNATFRRLLLRREGPIPSNFLLRALQVILEIFLQKKTAKGNLQSRGERCPCERCVTMVGTQQAQAATALATPVRRAMTRTPLAHHLHIMTYA